jgi:hypothetical protein
MLFRNILKGFHATASEQGLGRGSAVEIVGWRLTGQEMVPSDGVVPTSAATFTLRSSCAVDSTPSILVRFRVCVQASRQFQAAPPLSHARSIRDSQAHAGRRRSWWAPSAFRRRFPVRAQILGRPSGEYGIVGSRMPIAPPKEGYSTPS